MLLSSTDEFFSSPSLKGDVSIGIKCAPGVVGPAEADIDFDIIRNDNDTFTVKYTPRGAGSYTIMVLFADQVRPFFRMDTEMDTGSKGSGSCSNFSPVGHPQATPMSPIRIKVDPSHDASKVKAEGPGINRSGK